MRRGGFLLLWRARWGGHSVLQLLEQAPWQNAKRKCKRKRKCKCKTRRVLLSTCCNCLKDVMEVMDVMDAMDVRDGGGREPGVHHGWEEEVWRH